MKVFLGLVTHEQSPFNSTGSATAQLDALSEDLADSGIEVCQMVSDRDDYRSDLYPLTARCRLQSARAQAELEFRWRQYLGNVKGKGLFSIFQWMYRLVSQLRRSMSALEIPLTGKDLTRTGLRRLLNIELSHLRLWQAAVHADVDAILILEDDALIRDASAAMEISSLLHEFPSSELAFANLSQSFSTSSLGVEELLVYPRTPAFQEEKCGFILLSAPATNTLCATVYSPSLVRIIVEEILNKNLVPVQPVDWRVNQVLMKYPQTKCLWALPAPFIQASMQPQ